MDSISVIPLIDFGQFLQGTARDREQVASAMDRALSSVGFIYLSNYGIDQNKVGECFEWNKRFFDLSDHEKTTLQQLRGPSNHRGYLGVGFEKVRGRLCTKESFDSGNPRDYAQPNVWPPEALLPGFRKFMEAFFEVKTFANGIFMVIAYEP